MYVYFMNINIVMHVQMCMPSRYCAYHLLNDIYIYLYVIFTFDITNLRDG